MFRLFIVLLMVVVGFLAYGWFATQSLPSWYEEGQPTKATKELSRTMEKRGLVNILGGKLAGVLTGELAFTEPEFNALVTTSLNASSDGRRLLAVSDAVNVNLQNNSIEVGAVINLDKLARYEPKAKKAIEQAQDYLPLISDNGRLLLGISGTPVARNGELAISDDFTVKVGSFPISHSVLKMLGVKTQKITQETFGLKSIKIKSVSASKDQIKFGVGR